MYTGLTSINGFGFGPTGPGSQKAKPTVPCPGGSDPIWQGAYWYCKPSSQCASPRKQIWSPLLPVKDARGKLVSRGKWTCQSMEKNIIEKGASAVAKVTLKPIAAVSEAVFNKITAPIRNRVSSLKKGRAQKLAQQRRGPNAKPTAAETAEAKNWAKAKLKSGGPQGYLLALFAGADTQFCVNGLGMATNLGLEPATTSLILASLPILTVLLNNVIKKATGSGEIAKLSTDVATTYATQESAPEFEPPAEQYDAYASEEMSGAATETSSWQIGALLTGLAMAAGAGTYLACRRRRR